MGPRVHRTRECSTLQGSQWKQSHSFQLTLHRPKTCSPSSPECFPGLVEQFKWGKQAGFGSLYQSLLPRATTAGPLIPRCGLQHKVWRNNFTEFMLNKAHLENVKPTGPFKGQESLMLLRTPSLLQSPEHLFSRCTDANSGLPVYTRSLN